MPQPRRRPDLATGVEQAIPYDQTGLAGAELPPDAGMGGAPEPGPMDLGAMGGGADPMGIDPAAADPSMGGVDPGMGGDMGGGMGAEMPTPEDLQVQQMAQALDDPNIPPAQKQQIQQQLALAARRQLAGLGQ